MSNLEKLLIKWAEEYTNECSGGEYDYFDEEHFVKFLKCKIKELLS